jgi:hypothetical protein
MRIKEFILCGPIVPIQIIQNLRTLQGYIFRILQHFATKLCNFTNFSMLFLGIYRFFAKIKISLLKI